MRYETRAGSETNHCCFQASVVDTSHPIKNSDGELMIIDGDQKYDVVCECFDEDQAQRIADALNHADARSN